MVRGGDERAGLGDMLEAADLEAEADPEDDPQQQPGAHVRQVFHVRARLLGRVPITCLSMTSTVW